MIIRKKSEATEVIPIPSTKITEYQTNDTVVSIAVAEIDGRYPAKGFSYNEISREIVYVTKGSGHILTPTHSHVLHEEDVIMIHPHERFAWEGHMTIIMVTSPPFDPKQHIITQ